jgi:hypothetical protein
MRPQVLIVCSVRSLKGEAVSDEMIMAATQAEPAPGRKPREGHDLVLLIGPAIGRATNSAVSRDGLRGPLAALAGG